MEYDKINNGVCFREKDHSYFEENDPNCKYISVTTLIHGFSQPFDAEFNSAMKALEQLLPSDVWAVEKKSLRARKKFDKSILSLYNIPEVEFNKVQQGILDAWEENKNKACERGTAMHLEIENSFYKKGTNIDLQKFGVGGKFTCIKDYSDLDLPYGVYPEYLIYFKSKDGLLRLAGQIDLIIKSGNEITIADHKGLPLDTPIATESGFKLMKDIEIGDKVFDKDGNLCTVRCKSEIHHNPCYKITFDNSEEIIADSDHRWVISFAKVGKKGHKYKEQIFTTEELCGYLEFINKKPKKQSTDIPKILNVKPLNLEYKNLPIDPYMLGCWLGDGYKGCGLITQQKGSKVWEEIQSRGYKLGNNVVHDPNRENVETRTVIGLTSKLKSLNLLFNKHIPEEYLRASFKQRLDLLRGLMDTDGYYHITRHRYVMNTDSE